LRILLTVPSLAKEFGGPTSKAGALGDALHSLGHEVRVVGAGASDEVGTVALGRIGSFHGTPIPAKIGPLAHLVRDADVVHILGFRDPVGTFASVLARGRRIPYVLEPTGMLKPRLRSVGAKRVFDRSLGRVVIGGAGAVVVASSIEAEDVVDAVRPALVRMRPNGVAFEDLLPLPARGLARRRFGIPVDAPLIVTLARIGAIKGLQVLARSLAELDDVWWLLAGPDERDGTLRSLRLAIDEAGVSQRVVIDPRGLWSGSKREALADADVFCLPSEYESFGTAALEAAGIGLPVVMTDRCGVRDVLAGPSYSQAPVGDASALARAISGQLTRGRALPTDDVATSLRERLDWKAVAAMQLEIYESASGS
jgi:glycosyltransferase involved in cell wall biosynthesis